MRGPLIATGAVIVVVGLAGWQQQQQICELQSELDAARFNARKLGITLSESNPGPRRKRVDSAREAATAGGTIADLFGKAAGIERAGGKPDEELKRRTIEAIENLMDLSPFSMRTVLAGLRANSAISEEARAQVIGLSILFVSAEHPESALEISEEANGLLGKGTMVGHAVTSAVRSWAGMDPAAAADWLKMHENPPVGVSREELQRAVLGGTAANDPALAFRLLSSMDIEDLTESVEEIASTTGDSPECKDALLKAMRVYLEVVQDPSKAGEISGSVMETVARGVGKDSFQSVSGWLDQNNLSDSDLASFINGLSCSSTGAETGAWLDWMGKRMSGDRLAAPVEELVGDWVEDDYLAAGKWLTDVPDGPIKMPAVKAYAEAVAAYEPEIATQWAMTITDEAARRQTLRGIHENWPQDDEEGAAKFVADHGLSLFPPPHSDQLVEP